jgi:hypothetical protein
MGHVVPRLKFENVYTIIVVCGNPEETEHVGDKAWNRLKWYAFLLSR